MRICPMAGAIRAGILIISAAWIVSCTPRDEVSTEAPPVEVPVAPSVLPDPVIVSGRPSPAGTVRFAVVGDTKGTNSLTDDLAEVFTEEADRSGLDAVLMAGDNLSDHDERGVQREFRRPFAPLLERGVPFFASLGNHDLDEGSAAFHASVPEFHTEGRRYFAVSLSASVEVFLLDSNTIKEPGAGDDQLEWFEEALAASQADVRIVIMHHPIYGFSEGREPSLGRREILEPLFVDHGVQLVFQGHQHIYERLTPQQGVNYFITGAGGGVSQDTMEEVYPIIDGDDRYVSGMLWEIQGYTARFWTYSSEGTVLDEGVIEL